MFCQFRYLVVNQIKQLNSKTVITCVDSRWRIDPCSSWGDHTNYFGYTVVTISVCQIQCMTIHFEKQLSVKYSQIFQYIYNISFVPFVHSASSRCTYNIFWLAESFLCWHLIYIDRTCSFYIHRYIIRHICT
jgi:hypothetical protein